MSVEEATTRARERWAALMGAGGAQDRRGGEVVVADLPAPTGLAAAAGRGQATLTWDPVPCAIGYAVHRADTPDGPYEVVDHGGGDVLAVPHGPYADTTGEPGRRYWYAVAPLATVNAMGPLSAPVPGASLPAGETRGGRPTVRVEVSAGGDAGLVHRPWRPMVGSEHLSHLLSADCTGDRPIGVELREALLRVRDELGVRSVRAHGILGDDLGVYREIDGVTQLDFSGVDRVYDTVLELGLRPVVELSFMPRDLASDPTRTVFAYDAIVSPPKDWDRWADLVALFTAHLVDRYGLDVRDHWPFEVWNEANLSAFWSGTPGEYWRLYEVAARAIKDVDPGIRVGGPASAAVGWVEDQLGVDAPVDFLSTHTYGSPPLDLRPLAAAAGRPGLPLLWTEWGVTATHGGEVNDTVFAAAFLLRGMRSASRRVAALAPWVASDHFEELGRPQRLFHGGFGLLTVGNLAKPKFWALALAERLGDVELPVTLTGDGAGGLVECWAARAAEGSPAGSGRGRGTVGILLWNTTLDHAKADGDPGLDRRVEVQVSGLAAGRYEMRQYRVDAEHSNIAARWRARSGAGDEAEPAWPDAAGWLALIEADRLAEPEPPRRITVHNGVIELALDLPMPSVSYVQLNEV